MGCGFSVRDSNHTNGNKVEDQEALMGSAQSRKKRSPRKGDSPDQHVSINGNHRPESGNGGGGGSGGKNNNRNKGSSPSTNSTLSASSNPPFHMHNEVSSSQVNFFKMLDEKIENGIDLEEEEEEEQQTKLQRVAEEWDTLLGKAPSTADADGAAIETGSDFSTAPGAPTKSISNHNHKPTADGNANANPNPNAGSSVDSMKTMFSNSLTLPTGTLKEVVGATASPSKEDDQITAISSKQRKASTTSSEAGSRPASAIGGRTRAAK